MATPLVGVFSLRQLRRLHHFTTPYYPLIVSQVVASPRSYHYRVTYTMVSYSFATSSSEDGNR